ncbi:BlaI/MecI/CopY family transcriptional regulator [Marivirga harenae]|uniref:BlaI/MecI/CopY family transcriptional regulator n=1 Tax=Marivirga harenae TaxID=2010992 RepID=UPI0026E09A2A|nr:BlaI/MecI/CopY family transcriptional regulator [Marivirga harenae]WKV13298.1 BlaI/MecI/CopY family transcriptional regulator [Marivirga harenae]|tara:strand:+ start:114682 stop:115056 length:375 start_codon:yes stop_codon:yes gene_type:complete
MKLSETEEKLMDLIWMHEKVFMKDLIDHHPDPKPAKSTIATLLKRMQQKGFVGYNLFGNSRQYYALISKADYFSNRLGNMVKNYFDDSALKFASFFTSTRKMSYEELEKLRNIIDLEMKQKKDD